MPLPSLALYEQQTQLLLNDVAEAEYNIADLDLYINLGRGQIAAAAQCIRFTGTLTTAATVAEYSISAFSVPIGVAQALTEPRLISLRTTGNVRVRLEKRNWEWMWNYFLAGGAAIAPGPPAVWSSQEQGTGATVYFSPIPDNVYILDAALIGYPQDLTPTQTIEALPYTWTDSVPYFAAYRALAQAQRLADAQAMEQRWLQYMVWAGRQVTSTVMPSYDPGGLSAMLAASKIPNTGVGMPQAGGRGGGGPAALPAA